MSFQEISLRDSTSNYGTISGEVNEVLVKLEIDDQISEVAKKIFGSYYEQLFAKIGAFHIEVNDLRKQKEDLEKSWTYWVYKNNTYLRAGQGSLSGLTATGLALDTIFRQPSVVEGVFIGVGFGITVLSFSKWKISLPALAFLQWDKVEQEIRTIGASQKRMEQDLRASENLNQLAINMAEFISAWRNFEKNPQEEVIADLFSLLEAIERQCNVFHLSIDIEVENFYKNAAQEIEKNFYLQRGFFKLCLMDQICDKIRKGKVYAAWKAIKGLPSNYMDKPNAEPWLSLEIDNPDKTAYKAYFANNTLVKKVSVAELFEILFSKFFS